MSKALRKKLAGSLKLSSLTSSNSQTSPPIVPVAITKQPSVVQVAAPVTTPIIPPQPAYVDDTEPDTAIYEDAQDVCVCVGFVWVVYGASYVCEIVMPSHRRCCTLIHTRRVVWAAPTRPPWNHNEGMLGVVHTMRMCTVHGHHPWHHQGDHGPCQTNWTAAACRQAQPHQCVITSQDF